MEISILNSMMLLEIHSSEQTGVLDTWDYFR